MIAGEHTQAARVLRQRLGDPELGREVGDEFERGVAVAASPVEPVRAEQCVVEALAGAATCSTYWSSAASASQHPGDVRRIEIDGMLARLAPRATGRRAVESVEDLGQLAGPRPLQVGGDGLERVQRGGHVAGDGELVERSHRRRR